MKERSFKGDEMHPNLYIPKPLQKNVLNINIPLCY